MKLSSGKILNLLTVVSVEIMSARVYPSTRESQVTLSNGNVISVTKEDGEKIICLIEEIEESIHLVSLYLGNCNL